jgi:pimeloyl-ACP methyl ester carboxylesterase
VNPIYFGAGQRRLFGMYTPAQAQGTRSRAVVLCPPWGEEYLRAHRSIRQLAAMLAASGVHVLRFDYFGTGDSAGDLQEADIKGWQEDIATAIEELKDTTGIAKVGLVGMRLGGTLAATVAAKRPRDVDALGLWYPVASGEAYVGELTAGKPSAPDAEQIVEGFPLTAHMARELRSLDLAALAPELGMRTLLVLSAEGEDSSPQAPCALSGRTRGALEVARIGAVPPSVREARLGVDVVPVKLLQRIVEWLE